jgi:5-methylcytosine-specific restriction protein A
MRDVPEWRGKNDDSKVPDRVRLRIFLRHGGICHLSGRRILPGDDWDLDHVVALANGGSHSELNLRPALRGPHKVKTARDVAEKAKNDRVRKKHLGIKKPRTIRSWRKFNGEIVHANRDR